MAAPARTPRTTRQGSRRAADPARRDSAPSPAPAQLAGTASLAAWLTGVLATLCCIGLIMVASASSVISIVYYGSTWAIALREGLWMVVGIIVFLTCARMSQKNLRRLATPFMLVAFALLIVVLVPGFGTSAFGASRWVGVGLLRVQPSEIAKLALCLYAAHVVTTRERVEYEWAKVLRPLAIVAAASAALVLLQPDMGTAAVLIVIALATVVAAGAPMRAVGFSLLVLAAGGAAAIAVSPYRRARLLSFLHPQWDAKGTGYQLIQSKVAFGTGRLFGLGLGNSREKWGLLPNPHTDFIFSVIGEELGLVGTVLVLGLLISLVLLGLRVARLAPDRFSQLLAVSVTAWLGAETVINAGAATGLLPVTGIPLPFISFGGTSLVIDMAAVGLLVGIARRAAEPRPVLRVVPARTGRRERAPSSAPARAASTRRIPAAAPRRRAPAREASTRRSPAGAPRRSAPAVRIEPTVSPRPVPRDGGHSPRSPRRDRHR